MHEVRRAAIGSLLHPTVGIEAGPGMEHRSRRRLARTGRPGRGGVQVSGRAGAIEAQRLSREAPRVQRAIGPMRVGGEHDLRARFVVGTGPLHVGMGLL